MNKATTIWEDFTTGKKKPKEESEPVPKKAIKKLKSMNANKNKQNDVTVPKTKTIPAKVNSAAVSHSNSLKKPKKTIVDTENEDGERQRIIITTKSKPVDGPPINLQPS